MIILGAGLSGLIAGAVLRNEVFEIHERQESLPNNHHALLRFKTLAVSHSLNIPFKEVDVIKSVVGYRNPVADALAYSLKTTDGVSIRSSVTANGEIEKRFIAPRDLIYQLDELLRLSITYDSNFWNAYNSAKEKGCGLISTIPMPSLMKQLDYETDEIFEFFEGFSINADLPDFVDVCATLYFPDPAVRFYRASITERKLIIEFREKAEKAILKKDVSDAITECLKHFGLLSKVHSSPVADTAEVRPSKYQKIKPIGEAARKRFMLWATEHHNIYSLGRFATWRPKLLLDDIIKDIRLIQAMENGCNSLNYEMRKS